MIVGVGALSGAEVCWKRGAAIKVCVAVGTSGVGWCWRTLGVVVMVVVGEEGVGVGWKGGGGDGVDDQMAGRAYGATTR